MVYITPTSCLTTNNVFIDSVFETIIVHPFFVKSHYSQRLSLWSCILLLYFLFSYFMSYSKNRDWGIVFIAFWVEGI